MSTLEPITPEYETRLRENWSRRLAGLIDTVDLIRYERGFESRARPLSSLASDHRSLASYEYCLEHNLDAFKQHMHVSALSELRSLAEPTEEYLWIIRWVKEVLFSDNPVLIRQVASFEHIDLQNPKLSSHLMDSKLIQAAILGRDEVIAEAIPRIAQKGSSADRKALSKGRHFFDCLLRKDINALVECILLETEQKAILENDPYFGKFMNFSATAKAKLCHWRGIPIEIDHPLVPMDIVRIAPLAHYDNVYDFLEPGFVLLKPTLKDRWRFYTRKRAQDKEWKKTSERIAKK